MDADQIADQQHMNDFLNLQIESIEYRPGKRLAENEQVPCLYCGLKHNDVARARDFGRRTQGDYNPPCCGDELPEGEDDLERARRW